MKRKYHANTAALIKILSDGAVHDGNDLGEALGMTRSAVWKIIQKCQTLGVDITSVKGKGYAMKTPLALLNPDEITAGVTHPIQLSLYEEIGSTNDELMQMSGNRQVNVCLAEMQTQGRGRLGRQWASPFGQNIYLSCRYPFTKEVSELAGLSLVVSLSILEALAPLACPLAVKWPNDVICEQGKLAGTLIELRAESNGGCDAVIGIGLNVNMELQTSIDQPWTSLRHLTQTIHDRNPIVIRLLNQLISDLQLFEADGLASFQARWQANDFYAGKTVSLSHANTIFTGEVLGISDQGYLRLQLPEGGVKHFASGDAQLLKKTPKA